MKIKFSVKKLVLYAIIASVVWFLITLLRKPEMFTVIGEPQGCIKDDRSCHSCDGAPEGECVDNPPLPGGGWSNSISRDYHDSQFVDKNIPDGKPRVFKMPNYYGFGPSQTFSYGEPYYVRSEKY